MTNVLVIKGNNRPNGISTKMYETFIAEATKHEELNVSTLDVFAEKMPHMGQDLFDAYTKIANNEEMTADEKASYHAMTTCRTALDAADIIVFAFPLWNGTIPTAVQSFIDYTYASGYTFKYTENGEYITLLSHKKYVVLNARGGNYSDPSMTPYEMAATYVNNVIGGDYGMQKIGEVIIEGHDADRENREAIIAAGLENVKHLVKDLLQKATI